MKPQDICHSIKSRNGGVVAEDVITNKTKNKITNMSITFQET